MNVPPAWRKKGKYKYTSSLPGENQESKMGMPKARRKKGKYKCACALPGEKKGKKA